MNALFLQLLVELIWCSKFILGVDRDGLISSGAGVMHQAHLHLVLCEAPSVGAKTKIQCMAKYYFGAL
jgi:hypothetical protein